MLIGVPLIHAGHNLIRLMNGNYRSLRQDIQVLIGDHCRDLDNAIELGVQSGHFQIDPDKIIRVCSHGYHSC